MTPSRTFANSSEGQEIAYLSLHGYPLAQTQADLTALQRAFLLAAIPEYQRRAEQAAFEHAQAQSTLRQLQQQRTPHQPARTPPQHAGGFAVPSGGDRGRRHAALQHKIAQRRAEQARLGMTGKHRT